jgi:hypothetical protein
MKKHLLAASLLAALAAGPAIADTTINGFASIKAGMTTGDEDKVYGYEDKLDFKNESLFAMQIKSGLSEDLSVTAQIMGRGRNDFDAAFEWAFVTYNINENLFINAGRLRTPFYKYSDFKDVGYAYEWMRVPQSVYGLGFDNIEGASLYYNTSFGSVDARTQLIGGSYSGDITISGSPASAEIKNIVGVTVELDRDGYSFRAAYLTGLTTISAQSLNPLLQALNANGLSVISKQIDYDNDRSTFIGFGFNVDKNDWLLATEYNIIDVKDAFFAERKNIYVSLGYRLGEFTPFVSFESEDHQPKTEIYTPYAQILPPQILVPVAAVVNSMHVDRKTQNAGIRYDFHSSAALKVQFTTVENKLTDDRANLVTVGIDLVF